MRKKFKFYKLAESNAQATEANIFIHGYSAGHDDEDRSALLNCIPASISQYTNIFAFWPSSHFSHFNGQSRQWIAASLRAHWAAGAAVMLADRATHFWRIRSRAEAMGSVFLDQLSNYLSRHHPRVETINLIGHSLGARLIMASLKVFSESEAKPLAINDVLLMAAAVEIKPSEASRIRAHLHGRLINAYSKADWILLLNADENCLGRRPAANFENFEFKNLGHTQYWNALSEIIEITSFKAPS